MSKTYRNSNYGKIRGEVRSRIFKDFIQSKIVKKKYDVTKSIIYNFHFDNYSNKLRNLTYSQKETLYDLVRCYCKGITIKHITPYNVDGTLPKLISKIKINKLKRKANIRTINKDNIPWLTLDILRLFVKADELDKVFIITYGGTRKTPIRKEKKRSVLTYTELCDFSYNYPKPLNKFGDYFSMSDQEEFREKTRNKKNRFKNNEYNKFRYEVLTTSLREIKEDFELFKTF